MEYVNDLNSGFSPKLDGYCASLVEALKLEVEKPKAWQTRCKLIKAIGITECTDTLAKA